MNQIDELYKRINNIDYRKYPSNDILNFMAKNNLIVIQGLSDDILDMYGFKSEQFSANNGFDHSQYECEQCYFEEFNILDKCGITMIWCPDEERSWLVKSNDRYETKEFNIIEDGQVYCTGLIIDISSMNLNKG